eukprot:759813-Hanusia_phi.AAC.2
MLDDRLEPTRVVVQEYAALVVIFEDVIPPTADKTFSPVKAADASCNVLPEHPSELRGETCESASLGLKQRPSNVKPDDRAGLELI